MPDNVGGVAWPSVRLDVDQPLGALGLFVPFGVTGYILSASATGFLLARMSVGRLLTWMTAVSALGLAVYALAGEFWILLVCAFVSGITSGAIDSGLNVYAAKRFSARHITWMHAFFCVGAMLGPALFVALLGAGVTWRWTYAGLAAMQGVLAVAFGFTARRWAHAEPEPRKAGPLPGARKLWPSLATFALQTGVENGTGIWAFVYLTEGRGMATQPAGLTVSAFWAMMLLGRIVVGQLADRVGPRRILTYGALGTLLGAALLAVPGPAWLGSVGVAVIGFASAPMFPLLTLTTKDRVGAAHADRVIGLQFATSGAAGAVIPGATIGLLVSGFGPIAIGPFLAALAVVLCLVFWRLMRQ
ncbi:fucose permease [Tenggerimyces flavus]|nr:fucose permease [Tenggerimyces flavus]